MAVYQFWYADELGNRIVQMPDIHSFEYTRTVGDVGVGVFRFPYSSTHGLGALARTGGPVTARTSRPYENPAVDKRIHVYRQIEHKTVHSRKSKTIRGAMVLEFTGYLRHFSYQTDRKGQTFLVLTAFDLNHLLYRRIIPYFAGEAETKVTGNADDLMKEIVRDNFVDNADYSGTPSPARDIDSLGFSVAADLSDGPSLTKEFAWNNVLSTLQDLQADSKANGTEVFFGIVPTSETTMQFRTWTGQPGNDRTIANKNQPLLFSLEWGNLSRPELDDDFTDEVTVMYAGGRGQEGARVVQSANDSTRLARSQLNRIEGFIETSEELAAPTLATANRELGFHRPRTNFDAILLNTTLSPYGGVSGWNLGDKVPVSYVGRQFDVIIRSVYVRVDADKKETIRAKVESE